MIFIDLFLFNDGKVFKPRLLGFAVIFCKTKQNNNHTMIIWKSPTTLEKFEELEQVEILHHLEDDHMIFILFLYEKREHMIPINLN